MSALDERLRALLEPVVQGSGLVLDRVATTSAGRRRRVEVVVDLPDDAVGAVGVDAVAEASRAVSDALDGSDVLGEQPYVLEVTSPGADRPLVERRHFARARGRLVRLSLRDGSTAQGRLVAVDDEGLELADGARHAWSDVAGGRVELEFSRRDEPAGAADGAADDADADDDATDDAADDDEEG